MAKVMVALILQRLVSCEDSLCVCTNCNQPSHTLADLSIMVLEVMRSQSVDLRKKRESFWIYQLKTLHPSGMNLDP